MRAFILFATLLCIFFTVESYGSQERDSPDIFWKTFREAVLRKDHRDVALMTRFPFEVRGPDDSHPLQRITTKDFPTAFDQVMAQQLSVVAGGNIVETTMFDIVRNKPVMAKKDFQTPTSIRVHQLVFKNIGGKWLLTRAYLEK